MPCKHSVFTIHYIKLEAIIVIQYSYFDLIRNPTLKHNSQGRTPAGRRRRRRRRPRTRRRWPWCRPRGAGSSVCWPGWWTSPAGSSLPAPHGQAPPCGPARRRARTRTPSWSRGCTPAQWAHRQWGNSRNVSHWEAVTTLVHM